MRDKDIREYNLKRLENFAELKDGWNGEHSKGTTPEAITSAQKFLAGYPIVFPTEEGGVRFEWSEESGDFYADVVFNPDGSFKDGN